MSDEPCPECGLSGSHFARCPVRQLAKRLDKSTPQREKILSEMPELRALLAETGAPESLFAQLDEVEASLTELGEQVTEALQ